MFRSHESEPRSINGLYRVNLLGRSFEGLGKSGIPIYYYGDRARALKDKSGQRGEVYLYDGMFRESLGETWETQLEIMRHAENKLQQVNPRISLQPFAQGSTMIEAVSEANKNYGVNPLYTAYSRFADGSLVAGNLSQNGALVHDGWSPDDRNDRIGLLPQAVIK